MNIPDQQDSSIVIWLNAVVAVAGLLLALFALWHTRRSNRAANDANNISREANIIAKKAMQMQEDEGSLRLKVKPQMLHVIGEGEDPRRGDPL